MGDGDFGDYVGGSTVLVTGAAGSIGARLCARLARLGARTLVLVDQAEAPLVELATALAEDHTLRDAVPVLADIRNASRAAKLMARHRPEVVFHAAAYKQVPLMEKHPVEAVATNILGTKSVVDAARRAGVERLILFSTDKAVDPTSVLGRTKAVAEWIVAAAGLDEPGARYTSVRLGNIVDSAGSILPLFRRQVARGGPITVTHPETTRYLMTADEAAGLAIVAGALGDPGGVFSIDPGPPVRVLDIATRLAQSAPADIGIEFIGLRLGETLHEQMWSASDEISETSCEGVLRSSLRGVDPAWLDFWIATLTRQVERASDAGVRVALAEMHKVPDPNVDRTRAGVL